MIYNKNSIWDETIKDFKYDSKISKVKKVDICIVGGGITGVSIGYYLHKNNQDFILLEKDNICSNTTNYSTAKITIQHNLIYSDLAKKYGLKKAKLYLEANIEALKNIEEIILKEKIDCDFKKEDSYVFTQDSSYTKNINKEYRTITKLGYQNVELIKQLNIPLYCESAIKVKNQASFNPKKYTLALANIIKENIYQNCCVLSIKKKDNNFLVYTNNGKIICNKVVLATHFPIKDLPGLYFLKMHQDTSYVIAADIGNNSFNGMYINAEAPTISLRAYKLKNKNILLVGGNNIKTGCPVEEDKYIKLEKLAKQMYPNCKTLKRWNTQDCISLDKIAYIGNFSTIYPNIYLATGFNKWGMTTSNIAAKIITDILTNTDNKYMSLFKSTRIHPIKNIKQIYFNLNQVTKSLIINKYKIKEYKISKIPCNSGRIIKIDGINYGIYKDENGSIYKINPYCSHLKCLLTFNLQDKTWDCPCHGSRFDIYGNILNGPASKKIN